MRDIVALLIPVMLLLPFAGLWVMWLRSDARQKKWAEANAPVFPEDRLERVARAMCAADGRNPDSSGSMRERATDGKPGRYAWELYKEQAARFLAAVDVLEL